MSKKNKRFIGSGGPAQQKRAKPQAPAEAITKIVPSAPSGGNPASPLLDSLQSECNLVSSMPIELAKNVPIEFRAQVRGRAQRQYIPDTKNQSIGFKSDIELWIEQWTNRIDPEMPFTQEGLHVVDAQIDWRLISNSGIDEGIIRPVIGAGGWPLLPGSGIKGLFRRACPIEQLQRWCGSNCGKGVLSPGILRFHGAWPADNSWTQDLLDVAHPQQNWQLGFNKGGEHHSAHGIVSIRSPLLKIALSSTQILEKDEWESIDATLRKSLERGLGGRTAAGYGRSGIIKEEILFECGIEGQGPAAKLLDGTPEFRPTMFRAAIRGMALRLFGGLTDETNTLQVVGQLFGSLSREEGQNVGLLATAYTSNQTTLDSFGSGNWIQPVYYTSGQLQWRQARQLRNGEDSILLAELLAHLHGLILTLGGFGRGWRRPDHRIFYPDYLKTPIGTHWQWLQPSKLPKGINVQSQEDLENLLKRANSIATLWLTAVNRKPKEPAVWREVLHPSLVGIWVRTATKPEDAEVVNWFHQKPQANEKGIMDPRDLNKTDLAGKMSHVGRIWNRLLPLYGDAEIAHCASSAKETAVSRPTSSGGAFARPQSALARPTTSNAASKQPGQQKNSSPVSINIWNGAYLESVVVFFDQRDRYHEPALVRKLDDGADAGFKRVRFTN